MLHGNLIKDIKDMLNNNHFSPNAISHKELNSLLKKAKKEISAFDTSESLEIKEYEEFNNLVKTWTETSRAILLILNKKESPLTKNRNPKSFMAFGAMGAHINMALQALKAAESDK